MDDDVSYAEVVAAPFRTSFEVQVAYNIPQGRVLLEDADDVLGVFVDLDMPGGKPFSPNNLLCGGFELVQAARAKYTPDVPIFVISCHIHPRLINQAQTLGAEYLAKYAGELANLTRIAERLRTDSRLHDDRIAAYAARISNAFALTSRQADVLPLLLTGMTRQEVAATLGISPNTVKRHVMGILRALDADSVAEIRSQFRASMWGLR